MCKTLKPKLMFLHFLLFHNKYLLLCTPVRGTLVHEVADGVFWVCYVYSLLKPVTSFKPNDP